MLNAEYSQADMSQMQVMQVLPQLSNTFQTFISQRGAFVQRQLPQFWGIGNQVINRFVTQIRTPSHINHPQVLKSGRHRSQHRHAFRRFDFDPHIF